MTSHGGALGGTRASVDETVESPGGAAHGATGAEPVTLPRDVTVVVPTVGRPSLDVLLASLAAQATPPAAVVLVDDRAAPADDLAGRVPDALVAITTVIRSGGRGPAAARNAGWSRATTDWVVFVDDDVVLTEGWSDRLLADLALGADVVQGEVRVPLADHRRPTDAERNVARLETAEWITADMAVRRDVLDRVGGFDERFPRAYREDLDFALRAEQAGARLVRGGRVVRHPVRPDPWWSSVTRQRGNADDALLIALHGRGVAPRGRRPRHVAVTAFLVATALAALARRPAVARLAAWGWVFGTAEFLLARLRGSHRSCREVASLTVTSVVIPPVAVVHWGVGRWRWRGIRPQDRWSGEATQRTRAVEAVGVPRHGTG